MTEPEPESPTPAIAPALPGVTRPVASEGDPAPSGATCAAYAPEGELFPEPPIWKFYDDLGTLIVRMQRLRLRIARMEWERQCEPPKAAPKRRPSTDDLLAQL